MDFCFDLNIDDCIKSVNFSNVFTNHSIPWKLKEQFFICKTFSSQVPSNLIRYFRSNVLNAAEKMYCLLMKCLYVISWKVSLKMPRNLNWTVEGLMLMCKWPWGKKVLFCLFYFSDHHILVCLRDGLPKKYING